MIRTANLTGPVSRSAGGLYESVRRLVQELECTGMEVAVLGTFDQFTGEDILAWDPVVVRAFRPIGPSRFGYSPGYFRFLDLYKPEILHSHGIWMYSSIATLRYATKARIPYMISPHGMLDPWAVRNSYWKKWLARHLYENRHLRECTCLRALCREEADAFRAFGLANPICILPNGIDLPSVPFVRASHPDKTLLFLGRIHPKKGLENALRAWKQMCPQGWKFVIAGWEEVGHGLELRKLCDHLGIRWSERNSGQARGEVHFYGPAYGEAKKALLRSADAFILPSFSEGLPMSILEAWSWRLPVLMTRECNLSEGYEAGAAIEITPSVAGVADGLRTLEAMEHQNLCRMGNRGFALVGERFTWSRIAGQMSAVYRWMLGGGDPPGCVEII
jgi:poly(glycerol-phosphate) alpha-glucosyltransferase